MAPTPGLNGPYPGRLGLQASEAGTGLSRVEGRGKGCLSPRARSGNKSARWRVGGNRRGPREPASPLGGHRAFSSGPGTWSPASLPNSPGFCSPGKKARKTGLSWPADPGRSRDAGGADPCGPGSDPRRVSEPILPSILHPLSYSPLALPSCPPPARLSIRLVKRARREVKIGWRIYKPCASTPEPRSLSRCQAPRPCPRRVKCPGPDFFFAAGPLSLPGPSFLAKAF